MTDNTELRKQSNKVLYERALKNEWTKPSPQPKDIQEYLSNPEKFKNHKLQGWGGGDTT